MKTVGQNRQLAPDARREMFMERHGDGQTDLIYLP